MAELRVLECDGPRCEEEIRRSEGRGRWWNLEQRGVDRPGSDLVKGLTFCSLECVCRYAKPYRLVEEPVTSDRL